MYTQLNPEAYTLALGLSFGSIGLHLQPHLLQQLNPKHRTCKNGSSCMQGFGGSAFMGLGVAQGFHVGVGINQ